MRLSEHINALTFVDLKGVYTNQCAIFNIDNFDRKKSN